MKAERRRLGKLRFTMSDLATTLFGTTATFVAIGLNPNRAPVHLHHDALDSVGKRNTIAHIEWRFNAECDSREHIRQCVLQRKTQHDRQDSRRREQTANGQRKHGNQDDQYGGGVNRGGGEIRKEPCLAPPAVVIERE